MILHLYTIACLIIGIYMGALFILSLIKKDNSIVDIAYGVGFILIALSISNFTTLPQILIGACITIWGLRLAIRIYKRNKGKPEDFRYKKWRETWKWFKTRSFFQIYVLQGAIIIGISSVTIAVNSNVNHGNPVIILLGLALWLVGFYFEAVGDHELDQFIKNPENKGKIMDKGLWAYTRHPNYFGEVTMWWGLYLIALSTGAWWAIISPVIITYLLLKVSGIPMLEEKYKGNELYEAYQQRTNAFFPWKPKRDDTSRYVL